MRSKRELWLALLAVVVITAVYAAAGARTGVPEASGWFGHMIGVLGFGMMLMTETLYSLRKRAMRRARGRLQDWLRFHIFTGIVGPYMVLLHSAWTFRGLAGAVMLLTVLVVVSGFIGRYIYTAVPRTADGLVVEADVLGRQLAQAQAEMDRLTAGRPGSGAPEAVPHAGRIGSWLRRGSGSSPPDPSEELTVRVAEMKRQHEELQRQLANLARARRMLSVWHTIHIPLGMALFVGAFIHIGAAMYYATLLR